MIGDGSISAGMAYEAMNNAAEAGPGAERLIVVLNDNEMSIAPPVGAMSGYLSRLISSRKFIGLRELAGKFVKKLPASVERTARKADEYARGMITGGTWFEELGFYYIGPVDGHDLSQLVTILRNLRDAGYGPIPLLVITEKSHSYTSAEKACDKFTSDSHFNVITV